MSEYKSVAVFHSVRAVLGLCGHPALLHFCTHLSWCPKHVTCNVTCPLGHRQPVQGWGSSSGQSIAGKVSNLFAKLNSVTEITAPHKSSECFNKSREAILCGMTYLAITQSTGITPFLISEESITILLILGTSTKTSVQPSYKHMQHFINTLSTTYKFCMGKHFSLNEKI